MGDVYEHMKQLWYSVGERQQLLSKCHRNMKLVDDVVYNGFDNVFCVCIWNININNPTTSI